MSATARAPLSRVRLPRVVALGLILLGAPAALLTSDTAHAGDAAAEAEHTRLAEEMRRLAGRNVWRGVDEAYKNMLALEKQGVVLSYDDHWIGAQAARDLGHITQVYNRLVRARDVQKTDEAQSWIDQIEASFGKVKLAVDARWEGEAALAPKVVPFAPDQRAAIGSAQIRVKEAGMYEGLLPFGEYTFADKTFTVTADGVLELTLAPEGVAKVRAPRTPSGRRDGIRIDLGPGFMNAGTPSDASSLGVQADGFGGMALRAGVGWEVQVAENVGVLAQVGYHGLYGGAEGSTAVDDLLGNPYTDPTGDRMQLFYLWGAGTLWLGELGISLGPTWAGGSAQTAGTLNGCTSGKGSTCDSGGAAYGNDGSTGARVSGDVFTGGGTLGLTYNLFDFPGMKSGRGGISLYGGAQSDLVRLYPWGQIAFSIAPGK